MTQISNFLTKHWKAITVFYFVVNSYTTLDNKQSNLAKANEAINLRIDKLETIQKEVSEIKIMVNRIDERTMKNANKR